jgi:UMP-CMP kinase
MLVAPQNYSAGLLEAAMKESSCKKFLIDGFPRAMDQVHGYQEWFGRQAHAVMFLSCTEAVMTERILSRGQGRADDNPETLQKRLTQFRDVSMPVIEWYRAHTDILKTIDGNRSLEQVAADVDEYIRGLEGAAVILLQVSNGLALCPASFSHACTGHVQLC